MLLPKQMQSETQRLQQRPPRGRDRQRAAPRRVRHVPEPPERHAGHGREDQPADQLRVGRLHPHDPRHRRSPSWPKKQRGGVGRDAERTSTDTPRRRGRGPDRGSSALRKALDGVTLRAARAARSCRSSVRTAPARRRCSACSRRCSPPSKGTREGARPRRRQADAVELRERDRAHQPQPAALPRPHRRGEPAVLRRHVRRGRPEGARARAARGRRARPPAARRRAHVLARHAAAPLDRARAAAPTRRCSSSTSRTRASTRTRWTSSTSSSRRSAREHTFVMVSHDLDKGLELCSHALILARGHGRARSSRAEIDRDRVRRDVPLHRRHRGCRERCRAASSWRQFTAILRKDIVMELRTNEMLTSMTLYTLLTMVIYQIALRGGRRGASTSGSSPAACCGWRSCSRRCSG